jgi:pimeloyl-ACP methyl ester carboxylesterase
MATPSDIPLRQVTLSEWSMDEVHKALADRPLLLQIKRTSVLDDAQERRIIIFVHGLNSGATAWLPFLAEAFPERELQAFDFALFNYQTSVFSRLIPFQRLPRVDAWAEVLASAIQMTLVDQERYDSYILVGHSMGGLVCKLAFRHLHEVDMAAAMRLHSLFTYGTPNHGSDRVTALSTLFSPDLAFLRAFSESLAKLQVFWNSRVSPFPDAAGNKLTVHERAIISIKDYWVAPQSGINSLPEKFVMKIASSHSQLIRPAGPRDTRLAWFITQLQAIERQSECSLVEIRDGPGAADFVAAAEGNEDAAHEFIDKLFNQALFVLDIGSTDGTATGDMFSLYYSPTVVRGLDGQVADRIPGPANLLTAIQVKERVSYCKLKTLAYKRAFEGITRVIDEMEQQGVDALDEDQIDRVVLSLFGRQAKKIPRSESDAAEALKKMNSVVPTERSAARDKALRELLAASHDFLERSPRSVLAEGVAYDVAWHTFQLGQYEEAEDLFERFRAKYPFSVSREGADDYIKEIPYRIRLRDSGNAPESQLELAKHLLKKEGNLEETVSLAFDAYCREPALLGRTTGLLRYLITIEYVFSQTLGMELGADPKKTFADWMTRYLADMEWRQQTQAAIGAKAPDRAKLLLQLLDASSADWKDGVPPKQ